MTLLPPSPYPPLQRMFDKIEKLFVRGAEDNLRTVRGRFGLPAVILEGTGWSVVSNASGDHTVTFDPPFSDIPAVVAIPHYAGGPTTTRVEAITASTVRIITFTSTTGANIGSNVMFVAVGPA